MLAAANEYLSLRGHPDTLTAHFEFPSPTGVGPAIIMIVDIKLSQQFSRLHLILWQGGLLSTGTMAHSLCLAPHCSRLYNPYESAYVKGITMATGYKVTSAAALPPLPNFEKLIASHTDDSWEKSKLPSFASQWRSLHNWGLICPVGNP